MPVDSTKARAIKVLFASAEFAPLATVGGLGLASAGLVHELRRQGVEVILALPDYFGTELTNEEVIDLDTPTWVGPARVRSGRLDGVGDVVLVSVADIARPHPYLAADGTGWADNDRRFFAFSAAVAVLFRVVGADVLHLNDWHTATALAHFAELPPTVFTVHTLGYQGASDIGWLDAFPFHPRAFERWGATNPVAGAIRLSDVVVSVSPTYAAEIRTPEGGFGLDDLLRERGDALIGVLNGIDTGIWNPSIDAHLEATYSAARMAGKEACTSSLRDEMGLPASDGPLIGMVTRLTEQKGVDLALACIPFLAGMNAQLVVLGAGDASLTTQLSQMAASYPNQVAFRSGYDDGLSHRIVAGSDLFLMPSRFEPCGLAQMQAMQYGSIPVVTDVGGLHDTVIDVDAHPDTGTGIVAQHASTLAILDALHRAVRMWHSKSRRNAARRRGMHIDWSWKIPARQYIAKYGEILGSNKPNR